MKKILFCLPALLFICGVMPAIGQKYKVPADSLKLNKEYAETSEDIANLTVELTTAQNKLPDYQKKAEEAVSDAKKTAIKSSEQSSKAIDGDVGDAKKAKRKAQKALNDAQDVENANDKVKSQEKKIARLNDQLQKKQKRLQELEEMRQRIRNMP
jgi:chromosome segregation ATPase